MTWDELKTFRSLRLKEKGLAAGGVRLNDRTIQFILIRLASQSSILTTEKSCNRLGGRHKLALLIGRPLEKVDDFSTKGWSNQIQNCL
jgi:hypothetical protein